MSTVDDDVNGWRRADLEAEPARNPAAAHSDGSAITRQDVRDAYRHWAPFYDFSFGWLVRRYHRLVRETVIVHQARRVLEVGVGTGLCLTQYPAGTHVVGVDLCPEMLGRAQARVDRGVEAAVELRLGDAERLDFADGQFDLVVMMFVVSVTPNPDALLDEVARVLAPGGRALVVNHFSGVPGFRWLERAFMPIAARVGFTQLPLAAVTGHPKLHAARIDNLWPLGFFSRLEFVHRTHG